MQLVKKNTKFRANESRAIYKSIKNHIPNAIISSTKIIRRNQIMKIGVKLHHSGFGANPEMMKKWTLTAEKLGLLMGGGKVV